MTTNRVAVVLQRQRDRRYADLRQVYREEVSRGATTPVRNSTPIPGAMPRGYTRQGT